MKITETSEAVNIKTVVIERNGEPVQAKVAHAELVQDCGGDSVLVGQTVDGDWFATEFGAAMPVELFRTKWDLAHHLWNGGDCGLFWGEILLRLGWLRVDPYARS